MAAAATNTSTIVTLASNLANDSRDRSGQIAPSWQLDKALQWAGLAGTRTDTKRSDSTTRVTGIDRRRSRFRARAQIGGDLIFNRSFDVVETAAQASVKFLAEQR